MRRIYSLLSALLILGLVGLRGDATPPRSAKAVTPPSSPRISTVVYVLNGDLYVRDLPGDATRRLTRDGGNSEPRWSPSGNWIAYFHSGDATDMGIQVIRPDGTGKHRLPCLNSSYSFSPHTEEAAIATDDGTLAVVPLVGGEKQRTVVTLHDGTISQVSWSPDGRSLAYILFPHSDPLDFHVSLWETDASGNGTPHKVYVSRGHEAVPTLCGWSADSNSLLFWGMYYPGGSCNLDGLPLYACTIKPSPRKAHRLFEGFDDPDVLEIPDFVQFAPQGSRVAVTVGGGRWRTEDKRIALVNLKTHSARLVTPSSLAATCPTWSPDGKRIAFLAVPVVHPGGPYETFAHAVRQRRIWVMNADGSRQQALASGQANDDMGPRWLGDGCSLLFERVEEGKETDTIGLWMIGADGRGLRCIAPHIGSDKEGWHEAHFDVWSPKR